MSVTHWSASEKKIARRVFESALQQELSETMADFKQKAANVTTPNEMWSVRIFLSHAQRKIDSKYDFRYSQLESLFGILLREKRISEEDLAGLAEEKLNYIRRVASL